MIFNDKYMPVKKTFYRLAVDMVVKSFSCTLFGFLFITPFTLAQITLTSPNGGEIWRNGTEHSITWIDGIGNVTIEYSTNNGANWINIGTSSIGSYLWTIPNIPTPLALVRITDDGPNSDVSNANFRIISPNLTNNPVKILPIGNSITFDSFRGEFRFAQNKISYRAFLWDSLRTKNYNIDFIGHRLAGYYQFPDPENNGIPSITSSQVYDLLYSGLDKVNGIQVTPGNYLDIYTPDVVLLHVGINGITEPGGTSSVNVENILNLIRNFDSDIWVIVALIIDKVPNLTEVTTYNDNLKSMVQNRIANGENILLVDMHSALTYSIDNIPPYTAGDMYDDTHPNDSGKVKMANLWAQALKLILPNPSAQAPSSFSSSPLTGAYMGFPYKYNAAANGVGAPNYSLEGPIPSGMIINPKTGIVDWVPTALGTFPVSIKATNSSGSVFQNFNITVSTAPTLIDSIVSYWRLDEIGTPTFFEDLPGINNAYPTIAPSSVNGIVGEALSFDGSNRVDVIDDTSLYFWPKESFTIEMWVKTTGTGEQIFLGKRGGGGPYYFLEMNSLNQANFTVKDSTGYVITKSNPTIINDGNWHHIAGVVDRLNKLLRIYVDGGGASVGYTFHNSGFYNYDPLTIGYYKNSYYYDGLLDEIAIYNRRLKGFELARHYISGLARKGYSDKYVVVKVKAFLQGPFNSSTGLMNTILNTNNLIPKNVHPYTTTPWNYDGLERVVNYPTGVVDWVIIELRDPINPAIIISKRAAFIKNDGNLTEIDPINAGSSDIIFTGVSPGNYYVVVKHRNHLAVMSASPIALSASSSLYDFTTAQNKAFTTGPDPMVILGVGKYGMYAGDANSDGTINAIDYNSYWLIQNGTPFDYNTKFGDFNLDATINAIDYNNYWLSNNGKATQIQ